MPCAFGRVAMRALTAQQALTRWTLPRPRQERTDAFYTSAIAPMHG